MDSYPKSSSARFSLFLQGEFTRSLEEDMRICLWVGLGVLFYFSTTSLAQDSDHTSRRIGHPMTMDGSKLMGKDKIWKLYQFQPYAAYPERVYSSREFLLEIGLISSYTRGSKHVSQNDFNDMSLHVSLSASNCVIRDKTLQLMPLNHADQPNSIYFWLLPLEGSSACEVSISFWHGHERLGGLTHTLPLFKNDPGRSPHQFNAQKKQTSSPELTQQEPLLDTRDRLVDLTITLVGPKPGYIAVSSPFICDFREDLNENHDLFRLAPYLSDRYRRFSEMGRGHINPNDGSLHSYKKTNRELIGVGNRLWEYLPVSVRNAFWEVREKAGERFQTIRVVSNGTVIPWEMMYPKKGKIKPGFLGLAFQVSHSPYSHEKQAAVRSTVAITLEERYVIAPRYASRKKLGFVKDEVEFLNGLGFGLRCDGFDDVQTLFDSLPNGIIHYAGHGAMDNYADGSCEYYMDFGGEKLSLYVWDGMLRANSSGASPLFFINACHLGNSTMLHNFVEGWGPNAILAGVGGYIGGLWSLNDESASHFSQTFYSYIQDDLDRYQKASVAEALRRTRVQLLSEGDPTALAYVFYGDPRLHLTTLEPKVSLPSMGADFQSNNPGRPM